MLQKEIRENGEINKAAHELFAMVRLELENNGELKKGLENIFAIINREGLKGLMQLSDRWHKEIGAAW